MNILKIKITDLFKLERVCSAMDSSGKERIVCDYVLYQGYKNSLKITFEGFAKKNSLTIRDTFSYGSLIKIFDDKRLYIQGVIFQDGQFSDS